MTLAVIITLGVCFVLLMAASITRRRRGSNAMRLLDVPCSSCRAWIDASLTRCPYCRRSTRRQGTEMVLFPIHKGSSSVPKGPQLTRGGDEKEATWDTPREGSKVPGRPSM